MSATNSQAWNLKVEAYRPSLSILKSIQLSEELREQRENYPMTWWQQNKGMFEDSFVDTVMYMKSEKGLNLRLGPSPLKEVCSLETCEEQCEQKTWADVAKGAWDRQI